MLVKKIGFALFLIVALGVVVYAAVPNPGHSPNEIDWSQGVNGHLLVKGSAGNVDIWHGTSEGVIGTNTNTPLQIRTNDVVRVRIGNDGKVGIGTTSPASTLEVGGVNSELGGLTLSYVSGSTIDPRLAIFPSGSESAAFKKLSPSGWLSFQNSAGTAELTISSAGRVGIGVADPTEKLDVSGNIKASGTICDKNGCIGSSSPAPSTNSKFTGVFSITPGDTITVLPAGTVSQFALVRYLSDTCAGGVSGQVRLTLGAAGQGFGGGQCDSNRQTFRVLNDGSLTVTSSSDPGNTNQLNLDIIWI